MVGGVGAALLEGVASEVDERVASGEGVSERVRDCVLLRVGAAVRVLVARAVLVAVWLPVPVKLDVAVPV